MSRQAVRAGWLVDGSGDPATQNALLYVENNVIDRIEREVSETSGPRNFTDFSHCTLLPGLIDAHVHLFISGTDNPHIREKQLSMPFEDVRPGIEKRLGDLIDHGIVACRDGGDRQAFTLKYKRDIHSRNHSPIIVKAAGTAWHRSGRYGKMIGRPVDENENLAERIIHETRLIDHIKIVNSGLNSLLHFGKETPPQFKADTLKEAVAAGERMGRKTMVHANGKKPVEIALKAGCHSIEHGFFMGEDNLKRMADQQVFWVPTAVTMKAYQEVIHRQIRDHESTSPKTGTRLSHLKAMARGATRNLEHQLEQISKAKEMGVPIAVGTDSGSPGVYHGSSISQEMRLLAAAGFSIEASVQCACVIGAELLGLRNCGRLEKGMDATFIAVEGPPEHLLDNFLSPKTVYIGGRAMATISYTRY
jgi:imidazolonepropionase-like amidohydrolase